MTGLRKWSLSLLALIFSFVLAWKGAWDPTGWAWVTLSVLGMHHLTNAAPGAIAAFKPGRKAP